MLDKYTLGNTPACLYLTDYLNNKKDIKLIKKVAKTIGEHRFLLAELEKSNIAGTLSVANLSFMLNGMRKNLNINIDDELTKKLTTNVVVGEIKRLIRCCAEIRVIEIQQAKLKTVKNAVTTKKGVVLSEIIDGKIKMKKYNLSLIRDKITSEKLMEKHIKRQEK